MTPNPRAGVDGGVNAHSVSRTGEEKGVAMRFYSLLLQASHVIVWLVVLIGVILFLRREQGGGAISALLGACILIVTTTGYLLMTILMSMRQFQGPAGGKIMLAMGVPHLLGALLFAVGFLELARKANERSGSS